MISSLIATLILLVLRITLGSLAIEYDIITPYLPYVSYLMYFFIALTALFVIIKIIKSIRG